MGRESGGEWTPVYVWLSPFVVHRNYHSIVISYIRKSEEAMAPHSSTLAWKIPWMEEPGRLQSMGSGRVGHES